MSRILVAAALALAVGSGGTTWAQTQSTAPTTDAGTKFNFPATLGGATFERVVNYAAPPANRPDLGSSYFYSTPQKMVITVQVFDGGRRVPPGSTSPVVIGEFTNELDSVGQQIQGSGYTKLLLTGYQQHFVKIRIDWGQSPQVQHTSADADAALQAFIPALFR